MKVYSYHPTTGEYMGETVASPSPLEPGKYLHPANTTEVEPPGADECEAAVWNGENWHVVDDFRGRKGYINGIETVIKTLGPLPDGWSDEPPEPTPEEKEAERKAGIYARLAEIDQASIRPLRAIAKGTATDDDRAVLAKLEVDAVKERDKLKVGGV